MPRILIMLSFAGHLGLAACLPETSDAPRGEAPAAELLHIPAGSFLMGDRRGPASAQPQRSVFLDGYFIEATEVRADSYFEFLLATGRAGDPPAVPDLPAAGLPWRLAAAYCDWAGRRLPTEAEWEKAARGTDGRAYPWGDTWEQQRANTAVTDRAGPAPVDAYPQGASPYGVLNMSGNLAEWVADVYDPGTYLVAPFVNPTGPGLVMDHVLRGGSWDSPASQATTYFRDSSHSVAPNPRVGFRCASDSG